MRYGWSSNIAKRNLYRPKIVYNLVEFSIFNTRLQEKSKTHNRMQGTQKRQAVTSLPQVEPRQNLEDIFLKYRVSRRPKVRQDQCPHQNVQALYRLQMSSSIAVHCAVFRGKAPIRRAKLFAERALCFSCRNEAHRFSKYPNLRKCTKKDVLVVTNSITWSKTLFSKLTKTL